MQDAANKFLKAFTMGAGGAIGGGLGSFAANAMNLNGGTVKDKGTDDNSTITNTGTIGTAPGSITVAA